MTLSQSFTLKNCPCCIKNPCPDRKSDCRSTCKDWPEWEKAKAAEYKRQREAHAADDYAAKAATDTVTRAVQFRANKHYTGQHRKKSKWY